MNNVSDFPTDESIVRKALEGAIERAQECGADRAIVILAHGDSDSVTVLQSHDTTPVAYAGYLEVAKLAGLISMESGEE